MKERGSKMSNFYKSKKVLVIGGAGYVGSNLCKNLVTKGGEVISLDNYSSGTEANHHKGVQYIKGNAKDINQLYLSAWELGVKTLYYQFSQSSAQAFSRNILECASCEG